MILEVYHLEIRHSMKEESEAKMLLSIKSLLSEGPRTKEVIDCRCVVKSLGIGVVCEEGRLYEME